MSYESMVNDSFPIFVQVITLMISILQIVLIIPIFIAFAHYDPSHSNEKAKVKH